MLRGIQRVLFAVGFMLLTTATPLGASEKVFEVKNVYVDVTAENATAARKQAMREGEGKAFDILLKRLTLQHDWELLPWVEPVQRAQYIRDFTVSGEKTSSVRYLATYTYHFKAEAIRRLLKSRNIAFAETISKPVLVLPLLEDGARVTLWDEPNLWRDSWSNVSLTNGLVPIALPLGDLADISGVSAQQANNVEEGPLMAMAQRYGVNSVVVAKLVVAARDERGQPTDVDLIVNRIGDKYAGRTTALGLRLNEGETPEALLGRVANETINRLEESWKADNILQFGVANVLPVNLQIGALNEWLNVRKRLADVAVVQQVELALLSRDTVQLNLHFIGNLDQLIGSLRQVDLDLNVSGESWFLINLKASG